MGIRSNGKADWAIALLASRGASQFLENALASIARCGIDTGRVHVGAPVGDFEVIDRLAKGFGARAVPLAGRFPADDPAPDEFLLFGTPAFNRFMAYKYSLIRELLSNGHHVIYADIDIAWLRDPLPYLEKVLTRYSCAGQTEANGTFPPEFCAGFFAFTPGPLSLRIVDRLAEQIALSAAQGCLSDQKLLHAMVVDDSTLLDSIFPLPEGLFTNGLLVHSVSERGDGKRALKPFVFHANWTIGAENKRAFLKQANAWFAAEQAVTCVAVEAAVPS